jgi:RNA polymerase sigma-70 factor (ECF subfamily)
VELDPEQPSERRGSNPEAAAERDEVVRQLRTALAGLEPEAREVILLGKIQGFTYQEIAETLGCPVGTIKSRVHYAMAALRLAMVQPPAGAPIRAPEEVPDAM